MSVCFLFVFVIFLIRYCSPQCVPRQPLLKIRKKLFTQIGIVGEPPCQGLVFLLSQDSHPSTSRPQTESAMIMLYTIFSRGWCDVFWSYQSTMRPCICKSNCCAANNFTERSFFPLSLPALQLWKLPQIQTFILPDFLASSLQDSDNTISVFFFAVEKQTGLWADHYINSFLKGGSYFKKRLKKCKEGFKF